MDKEDKFETASEFVRVYPSDFKSINKLTRKRRTIAAQIIHEALIALEEKREMTF